EHVEPDRPHARRQRASRPVRQRLLADLHQRPPQQEQLQRVHRPILHQFLYISLDVSVMILIRAGGCMDRAPEPSGASSREGTLAVPGAKLYYRVRGRGPVLVVLQGGAGDADGFEAVAARLADRFTVVTYDRRGLSRSRLEDPAAPPTIRTHADDVQRLLAA